MSMKITAFDAPLGAEITGIDIRHEINEEVFSHIKTAWLKYGVIVIREQSLSKKEQIRFAKRFGNVGERGLPAEKRKEVDDFGGAIMMITNKKSADGKFIGSVPEGELWFHSDLSYRLIPDQATMLHALALPTSGGNTLFSNMYDAYANIPPELKQRLQGKKALHAYDFATTAGVNIDRGLDNIQHYWQPIFVQLPLTQRTALYVSRLMSAKIEDLERNESDEILQTLFKIIENPNRLYEHVWSLGDLVICDNRCCTHARRDFPPDQLRMLQRCTVRGEPMIPAI